MMIMAGPSITVIFFIDPFKIVLKIYILLTKYPMKFDKVI